MTNSRPPAYAQQQRVRILSASIGCFLRHGFHNTSMAEIAKTSGMGVGVIYRYFSSKREIIIAVISDQLNRELKRVRDTFSSQDLLDGIRQYFERESSQAAKHSGSGLLPEVVAEASRDTTIASALNSYRENIQMEVTDAYRRHLASQGDLRDDDWILQRAAVIALAVETVSLLLTTQTIDDLRQKLRAIETMIEDMVD